MRQTKKYFLLLLLLVSSFTIVLSSCSSYSAGGNTADTSGKTVKNYRMEQNDTLIVCKITEYKGYVTTDSTVSARLGALEPYLMVYHIRETK